MQEKSTEKVFEKNKLYLNIDHLESGDYEFLIMSSNFIVVKHERVKNLPLTLETTLNEYWQKPKDKKLNESTIVKIRSWLVIIRNKLGKDGAYLKISSNSNKADNIVNAQIALLRSSGKMLLFDGN